MEPHASQIWPICLPEGVDGPDGPGAQMGFEFCEGHLDRIEVGAADYLDVAASSRRLDRTRLR
jgi:hypothetical protein